MRVVEKAAGDCGAIELSKLLGEEEVNSSLCRRIDECAYFDRAQPC